MSAFLLSVHLYTARNPLSFWPRLCHMVGLLLSRLRLFCVEKHNETACRIRECPCPYTTLVCFLFVHHDGTSMCRRDISRDHSFFLSRPCYARWPLSENHSCLTPALRKKDTYVRHPTQFTPQIDGSLSSYMPSFASSHNFEAK